MLTQFAAAFDGAFLYRYTDVGVPKEKISVRYVMGPKERVLYDIINQAKNLTLPVVSMEQKSIKRDPTRIQFKDQKITRPNLGNNKIYRLPSPIPVIIDVDVSIIANYKEDIDQIVSNFIPWCNPYFIISWKIPEEFGMDFIDELRSEVSWSGNVSFEHPTNINSSDKYRISGSTSFTIKGWIFPAIETPQAPIYVVNSNFHALPSTSSFLSYNAYKELSATYSTDVIYISAYPEFTNSFYQGRPVFEDYRVQGYVDTTFGFYGKRFSFNNKWYVKCEQEVPNLIFEEVKTAKFPIISAYRIPDRDVTVISDNMVTINLSADTLSGFDAFTFVSANSAGWGESNHIFYLDYNPINIFIQPNLYNTFFTPDGDNFIAYQ